jgi:hypothetical protein
MPRAAIFSRAVLRNSKASISPSPAERSLEQIGVIYARNFDRVLKAQEYAFARAFLRLEFK